MPTGFEGFTRTRVEAGAGALARLAAIARGFGARRIAIVSDAGLRSAGHLARAEAALAPAGSALLCFEGAREDPTALDVARCAEALRGFAPDLLVALGGGSVIDTAKGAAMLLASGGRMQDYWGHGKTRAPLLPLVAVPTTAGTGSEVQSYALVADEETGQKMACGASDALPRVALLDPELTASAPPFVTVCAGLDALGHALETAVTRKRNAASDACARAAFALLAPSFPRVLAAPGDPAARAAMQLGATWAGMAIEHSMLGAAHALANPLSAHLGLAHGLAVGLALPAVVRFNAGEPEARSAYARLAREAGLAPEGAEERASLSALLAFLERSLAAAEPAVRRARTALWARPLASLAEEAARQWTAQFNARPVGRSELEGLLEALRGAGARD